MDGVAARLVIEGSWFWVAMALFGVMLFCIAVPASAAGKIDSLGIDSLSPLQRWWPVSAVGFIGLPLLFAVLGGLAFVQAGVVANGRTIDDIEDYYDVALDLGALDLPEEEQETPVAITEPDGDAGQGQLTKVDGRYHLMVDNERFELVEYGR